MPPCELAEIPNDVDGWDSRIIQGNVVIHDGVQSPGESIGDADLPGCFQKNIFQEGGGI